MLEWTGKKSGSSWGPVTWSLGLFSKLIDEYFVYQDDVGLDSMCFSRAWTAGTSTPVAR